MTDAGDGLGGEYRYEVFLQEGISDTLTGPAAFGRVVQADADRPAFVIEFQDPEGLTDGFVLVPDGTDFEEGAYNVVRDGEESGFRVSYRLGMLREFTGTGGTVELVTVSDTLIEGYLDVALEGTYVVPGEAEQEGEIRARGAFRASDGDVGFVVGL